MMDVYSDHGPEEFKVGEEGLFNPSHKFRTERGEKHPVRRGLLALQICLGRHTLQLFATPGKGLAARVTAEIDGRALVRRKKAAAVQGLVERPEREAVGDRSGLGDVQRRPPPLDRQADLAELEDELGQSRRDVGDGGLPLALEAQSRTRRTPLELLAHETRGSAGVVQEGAKPEGRRASRR